ncbi:DNA replication initiation control protein YabA [Lactobacillus sp. PV037]|uniref:DNA replication initiation control protein YabA n=1 Tax=unclassified Lactobacillus TaxID=2620435 RepID=UPI00223F5467|nr:MULTISPECIES: DNA replication initiation control protein YabA [unclassified Lactobacillus]QNQ81886.1 DNA replication initiation control protein YabA [Lactobacillus sp. PV012]QNQ84076.1 DNA replication initiation control protein YabA [Lactobacillus sp. PV037]
MDPFSQLSQLHDKLDEMSETVTGLKGDILDILKENTELRVENQLLREKLDKLNKNKPEPAEVHSQEGLAAVRNIYKSGYHICNTYYGLHHDENEDCMLCLSILDGGSGTSNSKTQKG